MKHLRALHLLFGSTPAFGSSICHSLAFRFVFVFGIFFLAGPSLVAAEPRDFPVCISEDAKPQVSTQISAHFEEWLPVAEHTGAVNVYDEGELRWVRFFKMRTLYTMCFAMKEFLMENKFSDEPDNMFSKQFRDPIQKQQAMNYLLERRELNITTLPSDAHPEKSLNEAETLLEWADICSATWGQHLKKLLLKHPEILSENPPEDLIKKYNFAAERRKTAESFRDIIKNGISEENPSLGGAFVEEYLKPGNKNLDYAIRGVTGMPDVAWKNAVALKELAVLGYEDPSALGEAISKFIQESVENPKDTLWSMMTSEDPADAAFSVLEGVFSLKGVRAIASGVGKKVRQRIKKELKEKSLDDILKQITDENRRQVIQRQIAKEGDDRAPEIVAKELLRQQVVELIEKQVVDEEYRKSLLEKAQEKPQKVLEKMALDAVASIQDSKFPLAYNSRGIREMASPLAGQALRDGETLCVIGSDLGNFKAINDILGHDVGDEVLQGYVKILNQRLRDLDIVARAGRDGGDEFVLVIKVPSKEQGEQVAKRVMQAYNDSELIKKINENLINTGRSDEAARKYLEKAMGADWDKKLSGTGEVHVRAGDAEFGIAEISQDDLRKLAEAQSYTDKKNIFDKYGKKADEELTQKKNLKRGREGTTRVK